MSHSEEFPPKQRTRALNAYNKEIAVIARMLASGYQGLEEDSKTIYKEKKDLVLKIESRLREVLIVSLINNFQSYISDLLRDVLINYPGSIESRKIDIRLVFQAASLEDLRKDIIDEQVDKLAYSSFEDLNRYFIDKMSFSLVDSEIKMLRFRYLIEARNSITHNRGYFNKTSLKKLNGVRSRVAKRIYSPKAIKALDYINSMVMDIDRRAIEKFGLRIMSSDGRSEG